MQAHNYNARRSSVMRDSDFSHGYHNGNATRQSLNGPGPAEEMSYSPVQEHQELREDIEDQSPQYNGTYRPNPRSSVLDVDDPVAMHLLMETAMVDSKGYEILSFEEVEDLKKERDFLLGRIDATQRKLALEGKLRDAAQSLNRLYSTRGRRPGEDATPELSPKSTKKLRKSFLGRGSSVSSLNDTLSRTDDELAASNKKFQELSQNLVEMERALGEVQKRILEHTAAVLQMTHKGLKKNGHPESNPQGTDITASLNHRSLSFSYDGVDDFDERSLYQPADYVDDYGQWGVSGPHVNAQALADAGKVLYDLNNRVRAMILEANPDQAMDLPPESSGPDATSQPVAQIGAHLSYLASGLETMEAVQTRTMHDTQRIIYESENQLEEVNLRLHDIVEKTNSVDQGSAIPQADSGEKSLEAQLSFSEMVLDQLDQRVELLLEQKGILTKQIQQQRELNSKADAQRDAQIENLSNELSHARQLSTIGDQEAQSAREQITLLMEQLDALRHEAAMLEQERETERKKALQAESDSREKAEAELNAELQSREEQYSQLHAVMVDFQKQAEHQHKELQEVAAAKAKADIEIQRCHDEIGLLEIEVIKVQTDLTVVRAELDGAYGTRAQRAADVSMNPAIQKEIDDLNDSNSALQRQVDYLKSQHEIADVGSAELLNKLELLERELRETIEDYELMTKSSIELEKERRNLEASIDGAQERCEMLERQLGDEKIKWIGAKNSGETGGGPVETTSTTVLKNEFKKMMREIRTENMRALRAEQDERRRLETMIRSIKKEHNRFLSKHDQNQNGAEHPTVQS